MASQHSSQPISRTSKGSGNATMISTLTSRWRTAVAFLSLLAGTNYVSFTFGKTATILGELMLYGQAGSDAPPCPPNATTPMLRGSGDQAAPGDGSAGDGKSLPPRPVYHEPSPHLWEGTPLVEPHGGKKTVLVTGAAGFIGSHVSLALLERGDSVVVVDELNDYYDVEVKRGNLALLREKAQEMSERNGGSPHDLLSIYVGDVNNATLMTGVFERHRPGWVCHLAARAGVRPSIDDPLLYVRANVAGTTNMLEYSRLHSVRNVVVASSSSVYGESGSTYFSEAEDVDYPVSPYAATKRSGELISRTYHRLYDLNITNLRFFTVYGPRGRPDMAPYKFIRRISEGERIDRYGDGSTSRDYTYVDDIVDGVVRAIDRAYPCEVFNLGKGSGTTLSEFIGLVERHTGRVANVRVMPEQPGDVPFTNADVSKARRLLGYEPRVTMEEGIRRTVTWYNKTFG
mmetsp:Transcript_25018/g.59438  ORF Transcript_25018/g.59438 Transcript_25018/m.59438 type:complete len:458 (-) Transcript_25018:413-1786(-)